MEPKILSQNFFIFATLAYFIMSGDLIRKSPNQLISSVRLHRAKELILEHDYTIAQIAFQTGFSSTSYFSKCFKKEFGLSPSVLLDQSLQTSMSEK